MRASTILLLLAVIVLIIVFGIYWQSPVVVERAVGFGSGAVTLITGCYSFAKLLANHATQWAEERIVNPIKSSVNLMIMASSNTDIDEIKRRVRMLKEDMEKDREFWKEFFPK